jgi:uncharacterized membrane protein YfcA
MFPQLETLLLVAIGLVAGVFSGVFGIGGGVVIVPALVFILDFTMQRAIGTSLAVLLPPIGAAAVWSYYRASMVDLRAAAILALMMFAGAWFGAQLVQKLALGHMKLLFGLFMIALGLYTVYSSRGGA